MKSTTKFEYCGFTYVLNMENGLVKSVKPACAGENLKVEFSKMKLDLAQFTDFERSVMEKTREIPYGMVTTYAELARAVGNVRAARAVGNTMARNPIPIVVPCHRVIKSDLTIGEYTHGKEKKEALLKAEGVVFENGRVRCEYVYRF
jgi:methylated-DNA-[protein]-cysteine S-methyltransferase